MSSPERKVNMCKKSKGIIKFFIACGIVISAVAAVFAVLYRMQSKLKAAETEEQDDEDEGLCNGSCSECGLCGDDEETEDEAEEVEVEVEINE